MCFSSCAPSSRAPDVQLEEASSKNNASINAQVCAMGSAIHAALTALGDPRPAESHAARLYNRVYRYYWRPEVGKVRGLGLAYSSGDTGYETSSRILAATGPEGPAGAGLEVLADDDGEGAEGRVRSHETASTSTLVSKERLREATHERLGFSLQVRPRQRIVQHSICLVSQLHTLPSGMPRFASRRSTTRWPATVSSWRARRPKGSCSASTPESPTSPNGSSESPQSLHEALPGQPLSSRRSCTGPKGPASRRFPRPCSYIPGFPAPDIENVYLMGRYDRAIIDGKAWGAGARPGTTDHVQPIPWESGFYDKSERLIGSTSLGGSLVACPWPA